MHNVEKWPNTLQKSCGVHTAWFLKYTWPFFNAERVKKSGNKQKEPNKKIRASKVNKTRYKQCRVTSHFSTWKFY